VCGGPAIFEGAYFTTRFTTAFLLLALLTCAKAAQYAVVVRSISVYIGIHRYISAYIGFTHLRQGGPVCGRCAKYIGVYRYTSAYIGFTHLRQGGLVCGCCAKYIGVYRYISAYIGFTHLRQGGLVCGCCAKYIGVYRYISVYIGIYRLYSPAPRRPSMRLLCDILTVPCSIKKIESDAQPLCVVKSTSACVSIRQRIESDAHTLHTSAYVSIRQHTSAYVSTHKRIHTRTL
jgi:hypothetical protein